MTSPWCVLGNKITALGLADLSKHTHMPRTGLICVVLFPDGTTQNFTVTKHDAGHLLFDLACEHLNIVEKQYFSLQISEDTSSSPKWLDPNKPFKKQLKGSAPFFLIFRVRFFISDPNSLQHEQTRHFYFLQIKKDVCEGRLKCPLSSAVVLASYAVQSELGDYVPETPSGYLSQTHFLPDQDHEFLLKVESLHPQHKGLSQSEAELCYLNTARTLDLYGVELHHAQDVNNPALWVGITSGGVALFCHLICSSFFPWKTQEEGRTSGSWSHSDDITTEEDDLHIWDKNVTADGDLLLVRISPDQDGKFGFNVKGGVDQKMPLAISHVNPASPAGRCVPPLMEGDQVLLINGRDISEHTHQQVVMFIKASRESHSKELALLVRRKGVSLRAEPTLQLGEGLTLPGEISSLSIQPSGETLDESMTRLERGLVTGTLLLHFEKLYRKKEGMAMSCAKQSDNMDKNRYKDVLPYDITRVVLQEEGDDYINASHVKTEPAGCVLRYIAAQGPLPHTCTHFWRSVWEQNVSVIVMLTTLTERGRPKCHQYWPHPPEVRDYGCLQVCCHSEECNLAYVTRELTLTNTQSGQQRSITHLQYVAWPDHGVPEDSSDFLDFVQSMRSMREESVPLMVHCSAGIGRTGVLITMETAMTLMEKEKPVYPLEIITLMREQRAMLVRSCFPARTPRGNGARDRSPYPDLSPRCIERLSPVDAAFLRRGKA
ncbi:tyrosine- phosphatase non-receptor type 3-like protein [Labeo rohita]|uniref:Tyrosine-phosphatase non-receptor type 3-like protein n=1 Tax=Labeo rohita TaxID=84645 RepID=A0A498NEL1_LABRO|nr:tyrosine- phosphatase non-receptor type 3-like protein [Labeo rohita]